MPKAFGMHRCTLSLILSSMLLPAAASAEQAMTGAAVDFLSSLSSDVRSQAQFSFDDEERLNWHFIPNEMFPRSGIVLKHLNQQQRAKAHGLLSSGLSESGYLTATAIMQLERVLKELEAGGRFARDHEEYLVSVFGEPTETGNWGWRFEGHHLSLHFTVVAGETTVSAPSFFGSSPAEVTEGAQTAEQQGHRALAAREDTGRSLVTAFSELQRSRAITADTAPGGIVTGTEFPIDPLTPIGIRADEMTDDQQDLLRELINSYTSSMSDEIAAKRWANIRDEGFQNIYFAWAGSVDKGEPHYYRVQGGSFLIEYDNVQNGANHVHSVWRDYLNDFGTDALREHYASVDH
jgi:hypothetical protein